MHRSLLPFVLALVMLPPAARADIAVQAYPLPPAGGYPHDVAVGGDGAVWYTAQRSGQLGRLDPATGKVELIPLGAGAAPHGVLIGPDGAPWITEGGTPCWTHGSEVGQPGPRWPGAHARAAG